jgi:hypothetical protein
MQLNKIKYPNLNSRQKEIFNFQKIAGLLADYGFNCIKLADDWQGADFLAYHYAGLYTLKIQLKSRVSINKKYIGKELFIAFPFKNCWYLIEHDTLIKNIGLHTPWLNTSSWKDKGFYTSDRPNRVLMESLSSCKI